jgi:hypothetical protein
MIFRRAVKKYERIYDMKIVKLAILIFPDFDKNKKKFWTLKGVPKGFLFQFRDMINAPDKCNLRDIQLILLREQTKEALMKNQNFYKLPAERDLKNL